MNYQNLQRRTVRSGRRIARAWRGIVIASLVVVILVQAYGPAIALTKERITEALTYTATAYGPERSRTENCDGECLRLLWLEVRAEEIIAENRASWERQARIQALQEFNDKVPEMANLTK